MADIVTAKIDTIATNPYRRLHAYPYIESKLEALQGSIAEVGLWPSVIVRPLKDKLWKYEMAFGHHRIEAARRSGLKEVSIIIEALSDKQMLQYMGRENLEDYNADFLIQLESWEAALKSGFFPPVRRNLAQPIEVAKLLGWARISKGSLQLNPTASACHAAYALIQGGYLAREEFIGVITVSSAELLRQTKNQEKPLRLPVPVKDALKRVRGNRAAGFCFPVNNPNVAYRHITARRHVADGLNTSANNLESQVPQPPELPSC